MAPGPVTVNPGGSKHWRRMSAPGWGGSCMSTGVAYLVVVQAVGIGGVAVPEVEDHKPVGADRDRPGGQPGARGTIDLFSI